MKKILLTASLSVIFCPLFVSALNNEVSTSSASILSNKYALCKKNALDKRTKTMRPALLAYRESSTEIKLKEQKELDSIRWNLRGTYQENYKKIVEQAENEMIPVNENIKRVRFVAQSAWEAEDALCDFIQAKASSTLHMTKKTAKKN